VGRALAQGGLLAPGPHWPAALGSFPLRCLRRPCDARRKSDVIRLSLLAPVDVAHQEPLRLRRSTPDTTPEEKVRS